MKFMLVIFSMIIFIVAYNKIDRNLEFINEFIEINNFNFNKLNKGMYQILICTRDQLSSECDIIIKFFINNRDSNDNIQQLKIVGNKESFNSNEFNEFFKKYNIDCIPNILILDDEIKVDYIRFIDEV